MDECSSPWKLRHFYIGKYWNIYALIPNHVFCFLFVSSYLIPHLFLWFFFIYCLCHCPLFLCHALPLSSFFLFNNSCRICFNCLPFYIRSPRPRQAFLWILWEFTFQRNEWSDRSIWVCLNSLAWTTWYTVQCLQFEQVWFRSHSIHNKCNIWDTYTILEYNQILVAFSFYFLVSLSPSL